MSEAVAVRESVVNSVAASSQKDGYSVSTLCWLRV